MCTISVELGRSLADAGYVDNMRRYVRFLWKPCARARAVRRVILTHARWGYPGNTKDEANEFVDVVIPSGMGWARNQLIINSADVVVSVAGGTGTLSELAYAWQAGKTVICYTQFDGWTKRLAGTQPDINRKGGELKPCR